MCCHYELEFFRSTQGKLFIIDSRVYLQDEEGNYSTSLPTSETFEPLHSGGRYTVRKLIPGRRFRVELEPRDQTGNQFTDARKELKVIFEVRLSQDLVFR